MPILNTAKATQEDTAFFDRHLTQIVQSLRRAGIRVKIDDRDYLRPGAKVVIRPSFILISLSRLI